MHTCEDDVFPPSRRAFANFSLHIYFRREIYLLLANPPTHKNRAYLIAITLK